MKKVIYFIVNIVSIFVFPWYIPFAISVISLFIFEDFYAVIFVGFILDVLYGSVGELGVFFTVLNLAIYILSLFIKDYIRIGFYAK